MTVSNYILYGIAFVSCFIFVHFLVSLSNPHRTKDNSAKEKFYTICNLTNYIPYSENVLFCSTTTNLALTTSHLISHSRQNNTYNSKVISIFAVSSITTRQITKLESDPVALSNIVVQEKTGLVHFLTIPTAEVDSFMVAWESRPVNSLSHIV